MSRLKIRGFTALELLVTMAIVAILLSAGVPTFKNYSWNLRMKTAMDSLQTDLNLARRRAISLNVQTVTCPSSADDTCSGNSDWQNGWIVFTDMNTNHCSNNPPQSNSSTSAARFHDLMYASIPMAPHLAVI